MKEHDLIWILPSAVWAVGFLALALIKLGLI